MTEVGCRARGRVLALSVNPCSLRDPCRVLTPPGAPCCLFRDHGQVPDGAGPCCQHLLSAGQARHRDLVVEVGSAPPCSLASPEAARGNPDAAVLPLYVPHVLWKPLCFWTKHPAGPAEPPANQRCAGSLQAAHGSLVGQRPNDIFSYMIRLVPFFFLSFFLASVLSFFTLLSSISFLFVFLFLSFLLFSCFLSTLFFLSVFAYSFYSFIRICTHSVVHSLILYAFIRLFMYFFVHAFIDIFLFFFLPTLFLFIYSCLYSFGPSLTHSLILYAFP